MLRTLPSLLEERGDTLRGVQEAADIFPAEMARSMVTMAAVVVVHRVSMLVVRRAAREERLTSRLAAAEREGLAVMVDFLRLVPAVVLEHQGIAAQVALAAAAVRQRQGEMLRVILRVLVERVEPHKQAQTALTLIIMAAAVHLLARREMVQTLPVITMELMVRGVRREELWAGQGERAQV